MPRLPEGRKRCRLREIPDTMLPMKITVLAAGRIKERWIAEGVTEYAGRLKRFAKLSIVEIPDEKVPERLSTAELAKAVDAEGRRMIAKWPEGAWGIALDQAGSAVGSEGLTELIARRLTAGNSHLVFAVGGSNGLAPEVLAKCPDRISFGPNTFPHRLFRVILLEQIYRAEKIRAGETYHK